MDGNDLASPRKRSVHFGRYSLIVVMVSAAAVAVLGLLTLGFISENLSKSPDVAAQMAGSARWIVDKRVWLPVLCVPSIVLAVIAMTRRSSASARWLSFIVAELWLLIVFGAVLYAFIASLAPAYQYQPLD